MSEFTPLHYVETIEKYMDHGYHISPVSDYFKERIFDKQILLRHDVDLSLDYALDMALLEKDHGIKSTYYILLHSNLYNAMSPEGTEKVREIRRAGHEIGLHVDTRYYHGAVEFSILSNIAETSVVQWCQHLITVTPPPSSGLKDHNAYIPTKNGFKYLSDSAMNWREGCWCNHLNEYDKMAILIHPEWTMCDPSGKKTKWEIMDELCEDWRSQAEKFFRGFKDIVMQYIVELKASR